MPTIRRPNVPPATIRLTRTRPAGDAAGVAYGTMANPRVTVTGAPAGTAAFVDYRTAAIAPVGTTSGLTYEVPAGSFAVRFVAPGATPRHVAGVMESDAVIARSWASLTPSAAPLRIVNLPNGSQVFVGESTTPLSVAALVGDSRAGVTLTVPAGSQTFRVVARDGSVRTQTVNVPWRWAENLLRILNFLRITPGMTVQEADEKLTFGLTHSWAPHDHEDARFLLAALPSFVISEDASLNLLPPLATLVSAAAETVLDYSAMPVATPATSTGSGTGVESRTPDAPAPVAPSFTIVGMPPGAATFVDSVRIDDNVSLPLSRTEGGVIYWVVPATPGSRRIRVAPVGGAPNRTRTVVVPPHGTTMFRFSEMQTAATIGSSQNVGGGSGSEAPATPTLRINGLPGWSALTINGAPGAGAWDGPAQTAWIVPLAAGTYELRVTPPTGAARTATVTVPATGERIVEFSGMAEVQPAAAPPSLRIDGRPQYSTLYVDSAANVAGAWTDASQTVWRMPLAAGAHTLRIVPTTGAARTGSVTVPATGEATIAWGSMVEERPAAAPPSLRIDGRPQYSTLYVDGAANVVGAWTDASQTVWKMPLASGAHTLRIVPTTGAARTGSVTVPATGEATIAWGSMVEERPAAAPPSLRIDGRPQYSTLYVDSAANVAGAWTDASQTVWRMPLAAGAHTLRIVPTTGAARTGSVTVPATGEATIAWGSMVEERPAQPDREEPAVTPDEPIVKPEERRDPVALVDDEADKREEPIAGVRAPGITILAGSGVEGITATRVGGGAPVALRNLGDGRWGATLPSAGRWNLTASTFEGSRSNPRYGEDTAPEPVDVSADEVLTLTYAQAFHPVSDAPPQDHNMIPARVIVRSTLSNVAAMLQGGPTVSGDMARAADGTLTASVASGTYQVVAWQEATPMQRTNVRTANVTVRAGEDAAFVYTGDELRPVFMSVEAQLPPTATNPHTALLDAGASQTFVLLHSIGRQR